MSSRSSTIRSLQAETATQPAGLEREQLPDYDSPKLISLVDEGDERLVRFFVSADLPIFKDHFQGFPVVPGVCQLKWMFAAIDDLTNPTASYRFKSLKYMRPMLPDAEYSLTISYKRSCEKLESLTFRFFNKSHVFSTGTLLFN